MWRLTKMWLISPTGISHRELNPSLSASRQAPRNTPHEHPRNTCGANGGTDANNCEECAHRARRRQRAYRYPAYHYRSESAVISDSVGPYIQSPSGCQAADTRWGPSHIDKPLSQNVSDALSTQVNVRQRWSHKVQSSARWRADSQDHPTFL